MIVGVRAQAADTTVAADGTGHFKSLQDAINAAPTATSDKPFVIRIKPGVYKELLYVQREKRFIKLEGEDPEKTIITYDLHANVVGVDGKPIGTFRTATAIIDADDFTAENITFENSAGPVGQALAIRIDGDRAAFRNCRFIGWQDTVFIDRGRQYFENCYITGHVDFIFGGATAFFNKCRIHIRKDGFITAASTPKDQPYGFVFNDCAITGEAIGEGGAKTYLARPWRAYSSTIFLNTEMSEAVRPEGWNNWGYPNREATVRYGEYNSKGGGATPDKRVKWAHKLTAENAASITVEKVLGGGDGWNPTIKTKPAEVAINHPGFVCPSNARALKDLEYATAGGESLKLDACIPTGKGPFPTAILVHGGGWSGGDKTGGVDPLFEPLTKAGIAWFSINYRLAPKHRYPAGIEDLETAIRWVKSHAREYNVDTNRIVLSGESAGGHMVAMVAVRAKDDTSVNGVIPFYAPVDLEADTVRRGGLSTSMKYLFGLTEMNDESLKVLRDASPVNYVKAELPPFLFVHGNGDPVVLFNQSSSMSNKLKNVGVTNNIITVDFAPHGMNKWDSIYPQYKDKVVDWIRNIPSAKSPKVSVAQVDEVLQKSGWDQVPSILSRIKAPTFPDRDFKITDFGAPVDGVGDSTEAIRKAIEACHKAGGGRVVVPVGTFLTGAVHLKSNVNLHISNGATLKFIPNPEKYLPVVLTRFEGTECMNYSPLIYAYEQENLAITGGGTLDGAAALDNWWAWVKGGKDADKGTASIKRLLEFNDLGTPVNQRMFGAGYYLRPSFIQPYKSRNILIEGVTIINSPMWEIHPVLSTNVTVRGVKVNSHGHNNDGCNPESCKDVLIEDSLFDTGDDCIAIKSGRNDDGRRIGVPSENIIIRNCEMKDGHGGVVMGSEISGGVRNVFVENCRMDSPNLDRALRFKSNAKRGGVIENIYMRNVEIGQVAEAVLTIDFLYETGANGPHKPVVRNVNIENVRSTSSPRVMWIAGFPGAIIDDIKFVNCNFSGVEATERISNAAGISFKNVTVEPAKKGRSKNSPQ